MTGKRVMLTGAAGFVGAVLCRRLLAEGFEVHALIRSPERAWRLAEKRLAGVAREIRPEVVEVVLRETGARVECRWGAMLLRIWDTSVGVADCTKAWRLLGWRASGLSKIIEWTRNQRESHALPDLRH